MALADHLADELGDRPVEKPRFATGIGHCQLKYGFIADLVFHNSKVRP